MSIEEQLKNYAATFRWEQDYYHRNRLDPGSPIGERRYNLFENGKKVYYTKEQFESMVRAYAEKLKAEK